MGQRGTGNSYVLLRVQYMPGTTLITLEVGIFMNFMFGEENYSSVKTSSLPVLTLLLSSRGR